MKTQTQEALKMAIEALDRVAEYLAGDEQFNFDIYKLDKAFFACKEALAKEQLNEMQAITEKEYSQEKEPVALKFPTMLRKMWSGGEVQEWLDQQQPLYTHPAPAWQGLSDDEIEYWECLKAPPVHPDFIDDDSWHGFARAIEQALKEKNT